MPTVTRFTRTVKPFWWMLVLTVVCAAYFLVLLVGLSGTKHPLINYRELLFEGIMVMLLLCVETIIYWVVSKKIFSFTWAVMHVVMMYLAMALLPVAYFFLVNYLSLVQPPGRYYATLGKLMLARNIIFWGLFIVAHVFLALTLIRAYSFREKTGEESLLGEFSDIH